MPINAASGTVRPRVPKRPKWTVRRPKAWKTIKTSRLEHFVGDGVCNKLNEPSVSVWKMRKAAGFQTEISLIVPSFYHISSVDRVDAGA